MKALRLVVAAEWFDPDSRERGPHCRSEKVLTERQCQQQRQAIVAVRLMLEQALAELVRRPDGIQQLRQLIAEGTEWEPAAAATPRSASRDDELRFLSVVTSAVLAANEAMLGGRAAEANAALAAVEEALRRRGMPENERGGKP